MRSAVSSLLTDSKFSEDSERSKVAKQQVTNFMGDICEEKRLTELDNFAVTLIELLDNTITLSSKGKCRSKSVLREKAWINFHRLRVSELLRLWNQFAPRLSPLVDQHASYTLYAEIVKSKLCESTSLRTHIDVPELTMDEENIVRYAAGFVPFKLLKRYEKKKDLDIALHAIECLSSMGVNGDESDILEYTRKWTLEVNRGGLFEINDLTYTFFKEIEIKVRYLLFTAFQKKSSDNREEIIKAVADSDDIKFYWTKLSIDIPVEEHAIQLLEEIAGLWVSIRGFSIAGGWLEQHKQISKINTAKSKALRKDLRQKSASAASTSELTSDADCLDQSLYTF